MANSITYLYEANDGNSFTKLSEYAIKSGAIVTINPDKRTILATTDRNDGSDDDPILFLGTTIDNEAMSFHITHVDNEGDILKQIADLAKENKALKADRDRYAKWHSESYAREDRIKKQVAAIAVLVDAIGQ